MCDPMIMSIASMVSGIANVMGEQAAINKQDQAYEEWLQNQRKSRQKQKAAEDAARNQATAAQAQAVQDVSGGAQQKKVDEEAARLSGALTKDMPGQISADPAPVAVSDAALTATPGAGQTIVGGGAGGADPLASDSRVLSGQITAGMDPEYRSHLVNALNRADAAAKSQIGALARVSAYGPSQFGLENYTSDIFQRSGGIIDQMNRRRQGIIQVGEKERAVDPVHYVYTPGPTFG